MSNCFKVMYLRYCWSTFTLDHVSLCPVSSQGFCLLPSTMKLKSYSNFVLGRSNKSTTYPKVTWALCFSFKFPIFLYFFSGFSVCTVGQQSTMSKSECFVWCHGAQMKTGLFGFLNQVFVHFLQSKRTGGWDTHKLSCRVSMGLCLKYTQFHWDSITPA